MRLVHRMPRHSDSPANPATGCAKAPSTRIRPSWLLPRETSMELTRRSSAPCRLPTSETTACATPPASGSPRHAGACRATLTAPSHALQHALALSAPGEDAMLAAELLFDFGCVTCDLGDPNTGLKILASSLESFERIEAVQWAARVRQRLSNYGSGRYC